MSGLQAITWTLIRNKLLFISFGHNLCLCSNFLSQRREIEDLEMQEQPSEDPAIEEIHRLCRVIAGDIALYNEDVISASGPGQVLEAISQDLTEGEALLDRKFPGKGEQSYQLLRKEMANLLEARGITDP